VRIYSKYASAADQGAVGEDRIKQVIQLIKPMDDGALGRLREFFPDEFDKAADQHLRREMLIDSDDHLGTMLDMAEKRERRPRGFTENQRGKHRIVRDNRPLFSP